MNVLRSRYGDTFHLVAANGKVLCRLNTEVPNAAGRADLGGFTLQRRGDLRTLANFILGTMPDDEALRSTSLCGRCRKGASIRELDSRGNWTGRS